MWPKNSSQAVAEYARTCKNYHNAVRSKQMMQLLPIPNLVTQPYMSVQKVLE